MLSNIYQMISENIRRKKIIIRSYTKVTFISVEICMCQIYLSEFDINTYLIP